MERKDKHNEFGLEVFSRQSDMWILSWSKQWSGKIDLGVFWVYMSWNREGDGIAKVMSVHSEGVLIIII